MVEATMRSVRAKVVWRLVAAIGIVSGGGMAEAQDPGAAPVDWTGPYATLSLGVIRSENEAELSDVEGFLLPADVALGVLPRSVDGFDSAGVVGLALGVNYQSGAIVGGLEAGLHFLDYDALLDVSAEGPFPPPDSPLLVETQTSYRTEIDSLATLRWRGGLTSGRNLVYLSAGVAAGDVRNEFTFSVPNLPAPLPSPYSAPKASEDGMRWGYVIGLGFERMVSERVSLRAEIMHFDLEDVTVVGSDPTTPGFTEDSVEYDFENRGTLAMVGLSISF